MGAGNAAVHALLKASVVLLHGAVDDVGSASAWGGARASTSKKRSVGLGTAAQGVVDGCFDMGQCTGIGVEEKERGAGNGWRGVEILIISTRAGLLYQTSSLPVLIINRQ